MQHKKPKYLVYFLYKGAKLKKQYIYLGFIFKGMSKCMKT